MIWLPWLWWASLWVRPRRVIARDGNVIYVEFDIR